MLCDILSMELESRERTYVPSSALCRARLLGKSEICHLEEDPHQTQTPLAPDLRFPASRSEKEISVVAKSPSLCYFALKSELIKTPRRSFLDSVTLGLIVCLTR